MSEQLVHWIDEEFVLPSGSNVPPVMHDRLRLAVPLSLQERRIYLYMEVCQDVTSPFLLNAEITLKNGGRPVGHLPAKIADFASGPTQNKSVATLFSVGGAPVGDSCVLRLANPFVAAVTSVVIQPLRVNGAFDEISFTVRGLSGAGNTGFRAYLACLSTKY